MSTEPKFTDLYALYPLMQQRKKNEAFPRSKNPDEGRNLWILMLKGIILEADEIYKSGRPVTPSLLGFLITN
jgi:hypothetical protein